MSLVRSLEERKSSRKCCKRAKACVTSRYGLVHRCSTSGVELAQEKTGPLIKQKGKYRIKQNILSNKGLLHQWGKGWISLRNDKKFHVDATSHGLEVAA